MVGGQSHVSPAGAGSGDDLDALAKSRRKLVDSLGVGKILITGQTLEYAWDASWDGGPILENSINDMFFEIFADGFESGNTTAWSVTVP